MINTLRIFAVCVLMFSAQTAAASEQSAFDLLEAIKVQLQELQSETIAAEATPAVLGVSVAAPELTVTVADEVVLESTPASRDAARAECEGVAYDVTYMWQPVVCTHNDEVIYDATFVAG